MNNKILSLMDEVEILMLMTGHELQLETVKRMIEGATNSAEIERILGDALAWIQAEAPTI